MVALKFLRTDAGPTDDLDSRKRFLREARAAASVRHPHVVAIREVLELADGQPVMVMELLAGETLRQRLARGPRLTLEESAAILLPVASAVGTAHSQGIVHRDLKPDNIFLVRDAGVATVKVLDFGIAKVTRASEEFTSQVQSLTGSGEVLGTPNYMSPEQVFGERDIDQRSDIWALGVILYECLTGSVPTKAANVGQVFKLIVAGGIKPLHQVLPEAPEEIARLVRAMLARRREQRPFDLSEIAKVLSGYTALSVPPFGPPRIPGVERPAGDDPGEPAPNADETLRRQRLTDPEFPSSEEPAPRRARLGRLTTIGIGILVVSVLIGESVLLWRGHTRREYETVTPSPYEAYGVDGASALGSPPAPPPAPAVTPPVPAARPEARHQPRAVHKFGRPAR
jgi:serine/threonine-protein kinase